MWRGSLIQLNKCSKIPNKCKKYSVNDGTGICALQLQGLTELVIAELQCIDTAG